MANPAARRMLTKRGAKLLQASIPRAVALANETLSAIPVRQLRQMRANLEIVEARFRPGAPDKD